MKIEIEQDDAITAHDPLTTVTPTSVVVNWKIRVSGHQLFSVDDDGHEITIPDGIVDDGWAIGRAIQLAEESIGYLDSVQKVELWKDYLIIKCPQWTTEAPIETAKQSFHFRAYSPATVETARQLLANHG